MRVTVELSLYPMVSDPVPVIEQFILGLDHHAGLTILVNQMSTQINGELSDVLEAVGVALERSFQSQGAQVLIAKFLNLDLAIDEPVRLDR